MGISTSETDNGAIEAEEAIDEILSNEPRSILDQLELPSYYNGLPFDARWRISGILFNKDLNYRQKHEAISNVIQSLPENQRQFPTTMMYQYPQKRFTSSSAFNMPQKMFNNPRETILIPNLEQRQPRSEKYYDKNNNENFQDGFNRLDADQSLLFDSFNALQYTVKFTFRLKELRELLSHEKMAKIYTALHNNQLNIEQKLAVIEEQLANLDFETLDKLFFVGVPIVDADVKERFRRLWFDRPYWMSMKSSLMRENSDSFGFTDPPYNFQSIYRTKFGGFEKERRNPELNGILNNRFVPTPNNAGRFIPNNLGWNNHNLLNGAASNINGFNYPLNGVVGESSMYRQTVPSVTDGFSRPIYNANNIPKEQNDGKTEITRLCVDCLAMRTAGASAIEAASNIPIPGAPSFPYMPESIIPKPLSETDASLSQSPSITSLDNDAKLNPSLIQNNLSNEIYSAKPEIVDESDFDNNLSFEFENPYAEGSTTNNKIQFSTNENMNNPPIKKSVVNDNNNIDQKNLINNDSVPPEVTNAAITLMQSFNKNYNEGGSQSIISENPKSSNSRDFGKVKVEQINDLLKLLRTQVQAQKQT